MRTLFLHLQRLALVAVLFAIGHAVNAQNTPEITPQSAPDAELTAPSYDPLAPVAPVEQAVPHQAPVVARRPVPGMTVAPAPEAVIPAMDPLSPRVAAPASAPVAPKEAAAPAVRTERVEPVSPEVP